MQASAELLAGIAPKSVSADRLEETMVNNLKFAADKLKTQWIKLLIEAINTRDIQGFYVTSTLQTLDLIKATGSDKKNRRSWLD